MITEEQREVLRELGRMRAAMTGFNKDPERAKLAQKKSVEARKRNKALRLKNEQSK